MATNREEVLAGAGSRYPYSANTLAIDEARERANQRRLPRAIGAHKTEQFTWQNSERHVVEGCHPGEAAHDAPGFQECAHGFVPGSTTSPGMPERRSPSGFSSATSTA